MGEGYGHAEDSGLGLVDTFFGKASSLHGGSEAVEGMSVSLAERELWVDFLLDFSCLQVVHIDMYAIYSIESVLYLIASAGF